MATDKEREEFAALSSGGSARGIPRGIPKIPEIFKRTPQAAEAWAKFEREWEEYFKKWQLPQGTSAPLEAPATAPVAEVAKGPKGDKGDKGESAPAAPAAPAEGIFEPPPLEVSVSEMGLQRQVFVSVRTDGRPGVGTLSNPFDGSSATKFDALMRSIQEYSEVVLLPGGYETMGFDANDQPNSWYVKEGWHLHGCGIERTVVKMLRGNDDATGYYVVIFGAGTDENNRPPWMEVSDLTIDCNGNAFTNHPTIQACHLFGRHAKIARARATNLSGGTTHELFTFIAGGGMNGGRVDADMAIKNCVVDTPVWVGVATHFNIWGGGPLVEIAMHGVIKDNYVDGTYADGFIPYIPSTYVGYPDGKGWGNAIGFSAGINMVIENNHFRNCGGAGPYQDTWNRSRSDITIRNNSYYNVQVGPNFNFDRYRKHKRIIIENNDISLQSTLGKTPSSVHARGITLVDNATMASGVRLFEEIIVRGNHFRFVGESMDKAQLSVGIQVSSADTLIIEDNLIRLPNKIAGSAFNDIWTWNIGRLQCRNNRRPEDNSIILPWNAEKSLYREDAEYEQVKAHGFQALGF